MDLPLRRLLLWRRRAAGWRAGVGISSMLMTALVRLGEDAVGPGYGDDVMPGDDGRLLRPVPRPLLRDGRSFRSSSICSVQGWCEKILYRQGHLDQGTPGQTDNVYVHLVKT